MQVTAAGNRRQVSVKGPAAATNRLPSAKPNSSYKTACDGGLSSFHRRTGGFMKGVRLVVDGKGQETRVVIDLKSRPSLWKAVTKSPQLEPGADFVRTAARCGRA